MLNCWPVLSGVATAFDIVGLLHDPRTAMPLNKQIVVAIRRRSLIVRINVHHVSAPSAPSRNMSPQLLSHEPESSQSPSTVRGNRCHLPLSVMIADAKCAAPVRLKAPVTRTSVVEYGFARRITTARQAGRKPVRSGWWSTEQIARKILPTSRSRRSSRPCRLTARDKINESENRRGVQYRKCKRNTREPSEESQTQRPRHAEPCESVEGQLSREDESVRRVS